MSRRYAWVITQDHLDNPGDRGKSGPRGPADHLSIMLMAGHGKDFRMYDDDGELYYSGTIVGDYDGFEPLDDFGMPNAGCTSIAYKDNGKWVTL